jgi:hypothetical protein
MRGAVQVQVTCTIQRDNKADAFVSHCPKLNLYSAGNTELESLEAIRSAVMLFLKWAYEHQRLSEIMNEYGVRFNPEPEPWPLESKAVQVGAGTQSIPIRVPFYVPRRSPGPAHA